MPTPHSVAPSLGKSSTFVFNTTAVYCVSFTPPSYGAEKKSITQLSSSAMEYMPSLNDPGEAEVKVLYDPANVDQQALIALVGNPTQRTATYTMPDAFTVSGSAYIAHWDIDEVQPGEPLTGTFKVQHSGVVTFSTT